MMAERHPPVPDLRIPGLLLGPRHPPVGRHPALLPLRHLHRPLRHRPRQPRPGRHPRPQQRPAGIPGRQRQRQQPEHLLAGRRTHRHPHPPPRPRPPPSAGSSWNSPQNWGTRNQTIEVDGSTNGTTWTTLAPSATYQFTAGSNAVAIPAPPATSGLPPPRHQRQQRPGRTPDRRIPGLLQLATRPARPGPAARPRWHPPGRSPAACGLRARRPPLYVTLNV